MSRKQAGFTLIELLIVLSALSIILVIGYQTYDKNTSEREFKLWYQQFELDLIYVQKQAMVTNEPYLILFSSSRNVYEITRRSYYPSDIIRSIPENWVVSMQTLNNPIRFSATGQIVNPGAMTITIDDDSYRIYFPFGKGRCYYVKI